PGVCTGIQKPRRPRFILDFRESAAPAVCISRAEGTTILVPARENNGRLAAWPICPPGRAPGGLRVAAPEGSGTRPHEQPAAGRLLDLLCGGTTTVAQSRRGGPGRDSGARKCGRPTSW